MDNVMRIRTNSFTIQPTFSRVLYIYWSHSAAIKGFDVWTEVIAESYLQLASELVREVYLRPNKFAVYILKVLRQLYGLADSGNYWHATFAEHLRKTLDMKTVASDMSSFFKRARG